ncbi:DUF4124 domain-containing protein [Luteimonas sp. MC1782]|uniref:DUF4124 domain-containing protein n=1 Tax=Luteimonas sp. MC1782 TaxID=2760305 RepID=UPI001601E57F|nr:DUF4124 domain-containing protein [Luteimonas sp. MC1782]MBB1473475.1 DUF4124 domain-containing protein [Luteimonas sp. MC1782]
MPRTTRCRLGLAALLAFFAALPATSATPQVVIYRCTDASGALTVQNDEPCPKGSRQERTVVQPPPAMPTYVPRAIEPVPPPTGAEAAMAAATAPPAQPRPTLPAPAAIADADRLPPPPIYRCNTPDNDSYISEAAEPKPRCVRLQTVGHDGDPNRGAGAACEMTYDQCERIPDGAACDGWRQRGREIESSWRYARGDDRRPLQQEFSRVATILADTSCGVPAG